MNLSQLLLPSYISSTIQISAHLAARMAISLCSPEQRREINEITINSRRVRWRQSSRFWMRKHVAARVVSLVSSTHMMPSFMIAKPRTRTRLNELQLNQIRIVFTFHPSPRRPTSSHLPSTVSPLMANLFISIILVLHVFQKLVRLY